MAQLNSVVLQGRNLCFCVDFHIGLNVTPWNRLEIVVVATNYCHNWGSGYYNSIKRVLSQFLPE